ncbi:tryptophan halogenase [Alteromonadaceae bacterium Bs31]|nr:tryptophan halogenase [Alteromonadaceae bacterium Bs31]
MGNAVKNIIILGGGSAGWLTAGLIASEHGIDRARGMNITLVESPDIPIIGVGEGTWPTMRRTLKKIGVSESDLFKECEASFKQGAKFEKWVNGTADDFYYHPLVEPLGYSDTELFYQWKNGEYNTSFGDAFCFQGHICEHGRAPKLITTPEYSGIANYAYHLNAYKLGEFLKKHCINKLGVNHVIDNVLKACSHDNGDIAALETENKGLLKADLFIDCSGLSSILLGKHYGIPFISKRHILFNDSALAAQVPYREPDDAITSHTISTAQKNGWIWDIGLPSRRGVGHTYSSAHTSDEQAEIELRQYICHSLGEQRSAELSLRKISFEPGHREVFWHRNCVAVGMASGFLEPLEASALVLVEMAANRISEEMPANRTVMDIVSKRYNQRFLYNWDAIVDFLKLHYVLSKRTDSQYWLDNVSKESIPERLRELMLLWRYQPPNRHDFPYAEEVFPSASWQYVLYGMGFNSSQRPTRKAMNRSALSDKYFRETQEFAARCVSKLPSNRELIDKIVQFGMQPV